METFLFTSESVNEGHPDKLYDQVSAPGSNRALRARLHARPAPTNMVMVSEHSEKLKQWITMGLGLPVVAIILHFTNAIPINKQLYSISYVCFMSGAAGIVFSAFYVVIDVWGFRTPFLFLEWIGMNAMLVYVMAAQGIFQAFINCWYYEDPKNSLVNWMKKHVFVNMQH